MVDDKKKKDEEKIEEKERVEQSDQVIKEEVGEGDKPNTKRPGS